ncbi:MAG: PAS domain-containing protein [Alphaproteobacteria bacterium]
MRTRLSLKIFIPLVLLLFGLLVIAVDYFVGLTQELEQNRAGTMRRADVHGKQLTEVAKRFLAKHDLEGAQIELTLSTSIPRLTLAVICDASNRILLSSQERWQNQPLAQTPLAAALPLIEKARRQMSGFTGDMDNGHFIVGAYPFPLPLKVGDVAGPDIGMVVVQFDLAALNQEAREQALQAEEHTAIGLLLLSLLLWFVLDRKLTVRVKKLVATTREIEHGNLAAKSGLPAGDELGEISAALDRMGDAVRRRMEILSENDELKKTQQALEESRARLQAILDHIPAIVFMKDVEGRYLVINRWYANLLKLSEQDVRGKTPHEILPPDVADQFIAAHQRVVQTQTVQTFEQHISSDDNRITVLSTQFPILDRSGQMIAMGGVSIDITDRKNAEQALRQSERRFRAIFDGAYEFVGLLDIGGTLVEINQTALDFIGARAADVVGRPFWETPWWSTAAEQRERLKAAIAEAREGKFVRFEAEHRGKDGSAEIVDFSVRPMTDETGRVVMLIPEGRRITEQKQAEAALREADRRKDEFIAMLAHELRNPLAPIRNVINLLQRRRSLDPQVQRGGAIIARQLDYLTRLINDLLDVSRISRDKLELRTERVDLVEIIKAAVEDSRPFIDQHGHELTLAFPEKAIYLNADSVRLAQVFTNLLDNAAKYTHRQGHLALSVRLEGSTVVVRVTDDGIGIAPEKLPHLFDMFYQADRSYEQSQGGLGIGLTLVRRLVDLHGGAVEAHSSGRDQGSEFVVRLPISLEEPEQEENIDLCPKLLATSRRILVVDDYGESADTLADLLRLDGNEVEIAHDGFEAVEAAANFRPAVVLLDVAMPKLNGYDAARRIREQPWGKKIVLIAVTGWGQARDRQQSREAGFDAHLTKPVDYPALLRMLAELLPGGSQPRSSEESL